MALWQVSCGQGGEKLLGLAEGLIKKHIAAHSLHEPEGLYWAPFPISERNGVIRLVMALNDLHILQLL